MDNWLRKNEGAERLPVIIPVVLFHGRQPWTGSRRLRDLFDIPPGLEAELRPFIPDLELILEDLSSRSDEELAGWSLTAMVNVVLRLLKHAFDEDLGRRLPELLSVLRARLETDEGLQELREVLIYVATVSSAVEVADWEAVGRSLGSRAEELVMTLAERLEERGLQQGLLEGQRELILRLLRLKFPDTLPGDIESRLRSATGSELERWAERFVTAGTLDEVFADDSGAPER